MCSIYIFKISKILQTKLYPNKLYKLPNIIVKFSPTIEPIPKMYKKNSITDKQSLKRILELQTTALITDFKYNHNGTKLAVSDSEGNVFIYQRSSDIFVKVSQFKGDQAAIWKLSWADPQFGELLAIGSFKKKVGIFQNKNNKWMQIARHQHHEGSVNHVQWAPAAYGIKLYSAGSDGKVCIFEVRKNSWQLLAFPTHDSSINSLTIKPIPLNQQKNSGFQTIYPTIATISKDLMLRVWRHNSQARYLKLSNIQDYPQGAYLQIVSIKPHAQLTRTIQFQPIWNQDDDLPSYSIFSGSEDGKVKLNIFKKDQFDSQQIIHEGEAPVVSLSQSLTGKYLLVGTSSHNQEKTVLYIQKQKGEWQCVQQQQ